MAELLARLHMKGARRAIAVAATGALGALLLWLAVIAGAGLAGRLVLAGFGGLALWAAVAVHRATRKDLLLTREGIFDETGRMLAAMENIEAVERGVFAFKPSSGFAVTLKEKTPSGWAPGVWWRVGRRLGVGGAVPGPEAKAMAEILELALADRAGRLRRD